VHVRMLFMLASLMLCPSLRAQEGQAPFCTSPLISGPNGQSGHLVFSPASPEAGQPVAITAGRHIFIPSDISADVQGEIINVQITGHLDQFTTPGGDKCVSTSLPSLARGTYTVNVYSIDATLPGDPPLLFLSQTLSVTGGAQPVVAAPTVSFDALAALAALLATTAFLALRRND